MTFLNSATSRQFSGRRHSSLTFTKERDYFTFNIDPRGCSDKKLRYVAIVGWDERGTVEAVAIEHPSGQQECSAFVPSANPWDRVIR